MDSLQSELAKLINKHSRENESGTPDFILAEYLMLCLKNFEGAVVARDRWYKTHGYGHTGGSAGGG